MFEEFVPYLKEAKNGEKGRLIAEMCRLTGYSKDKVYRELKKAGWESGRKKRSDAGTTSVSELALRQVAAQLNVGIKDNKNITMEIPTATYILKNNGVDIGVSNNRIAELLRERGLDIKSQKKPKTFIRMRSLYPNHVHQVDPSVCLVYYLPKGGQRVIETREAYKNKPFLEDKAHLKVWRYVLTDHYSGTVCVRYYQTPGESKEVLWDFLLYCWGKKNDPNYVFHGVPELLVWDKGSANTSKAVANAMDSLRVNHYAHAVGRPNVKGQVESGNRLVERHLEPLLRAEPVQNVDELNYYAEKWCSAFNAGLLKGYNSDLRRAKKPRRDLWNTIPFDKLRELPEDAKKLLTVEPVTRKVGGDLKITFVHPRIKESRPYLVGGLPGVRPGLEVNVQPIMMDNAGVIKISYTYQDEEFTEELLPIELDEAGFHMDGAVWGEEYKSNKDTYVDKAVKSLTEVIGEDKVPFQNFNNGQGLKTLSIIGSKETNSISMPRVGQTINVHEAPKLIMSVIEASTVLKSRLGFWDKKYLLYLKATYSNGVPDSELDNLENLFAGKGVDFAEGKESVG